MLLHATMAILESFHVAPDDSCKFSLPLERISHWKTMYGTIETLILFSLDQNLYYVVYTYDVKVCLPLYGVYTGR